MNHIDLDIDTPGSGEPGDDGKRRIGRFVIEELLGKGGMGEVYKAWDPENNRTVALKVLGIQGYEDPDTLKRFEREAESALVLDHVNIARFYGADHDEQGRPIIAMEYIAGRGLDQVLDDDLELPFSQLVDYIIQTARGLENAYRRSIIHRDIKPGNLILDENGVVKIIDFGLAKCLWDNTALTGSGLVVGTPRYISPEQGMGRNVDHRSDIYSLGATFYELVTGRTPFEGDAPLAIMMKHINSPLVPPYIVNPRVPADISDIIMKMMAKEPGHRYQDYEPLIRDLESAKIHRLSKERRNPGELSAMNTVMLAENLPADQAAGAPSSYLTEGLVNVELNHDDEEETGTSPMKVILLSLAGIMVVGFAVLFLMKPTAVEGGEPSSLGQKLGAVLANFKKKLGPADTVEDAAAIDRANIDTTRGRMEAVVSKVLNMRANSSLSAIPTIAQLRDNQVFTVEQTQDAWGNNFVITDSGGGAVLIAAGRDGQEGTEDDFLFSLDGSRAEIPKPLDPDEVMMRDN